jgi:hypothetical protein
MFQTNSELVQTCAKNTNNKSEQVQTQFKHVQNKFKQRSTHILTTFRNSPQNKFGQNVITSPEQVQTMFNNKFRKTKTLNVQPCSKTVPYSSRQVQNKFKNTTENVQNMFKATSTNVQHKFKNKSENVQNESINKSQTFNKCSDKVQTQFRNSSTNIEKQQKCPERVQICSTTNVQNTLFLNIAIKHVTYVFEYCLYK